MSWEYYMPYNRSSRKKLQLLSKDELENLYYDSSLLEIANYIGVSESSILARMKELSIPRRESKKRAIVIEPTFEEEQVIIGTTLGDGCIEKPSSRSGLLSISHCSAQKEYLMWKATKLSRFATPYGVKFDPITSKQTNKVYGAYTFYTKSCTYLASLADLFYQTVDSKRTKVITRTILDKLDRLGLAIWFMDDGSRCYSVLEIVVPIVSREIIRKWFSDRWKLDVEFQVVVPPVENVVFKYNQAQKFVQLVEEFIVPTMQYKIAI